VCLGIDVEGCEGIGEGITSIGIALLPPTELLSRTFPSLPFQTEKFVEWYQVECRCFYIEGRSRRKPHPPFPFGSIVKTVELDGEMKVIINDIKKRYASNNTVLIGWYPHPRELPAIQALVPILFQEVVG
jgi:hypothetical protein